MSIKFKCDECGRELSAPDSAAGRKGKCNCGAVLQVPDPAVAEPEPDFDNLSYEAAAPAPLPVATQPAKPQRPCPRCGEMIAIGAAKCRHCNEVFGSRPKQAASGTTAHSGWRIIRYGLKTIYHAISVILIAFILLIVMAVGGGAIGRESVDALSIIPIIGVVGGTVAIIVGQLMCCVSPQGIGTKALALAAGICTISNTVCALPSVNDPLLRFVGSLASIVGIFLTVLFLGSVARFFGNHSLADSARGFLLFIFCLTCGVVGMAFFPYLIAVTVGRNSFAAAGLAVLLGLGFFVCAIITLAWYRRLLRELIDTIDGQGGRGGRVAAIPASRAS